MPNKNPNENSSKEEKKETNQNKTTEETTEKTKNINENIKENTNETKDTKKVKEPKETENAKDTKEKISEAKEKILEEVNEATKEIKEDSKEIKEKLNNAKETIQEKAAYFKDKTEDILKDVVDSSQKYDKKDIEANKGMAVLSYILAPIPYFTETKSKWVHYHAIQGMNLLIIAIISSLIVSIINVLLLWPLHFLGTLLGTIVSAGIVILAIIGIVNVCNGEAKELPLINKFKIIKK